MKIKSNRLKRKAPHLTITCDLPIFKPFITLLANVIERHPKVFSITLNYSNPDYTAETGGYRPVEIRIERKQDNRWYILLHNRIYLYDDTVWPRINVCH
ncbi:DUF2787 family protein [Budvicia aquatica]|uniref:Protein of uncharacterized function (DUF2787) n=1 Tax=Budvicia aquatica TaxID=82979 RepID=A0A484ZQI9_9GAMM|nr:Protein of uncharacterised function (DUF2787) [Budvicia aquatica]